MSIKIRKRARKKSMDVATPSVARFRAARADEAELRVDKIRANTMSLEDAAERVTRRFGVVRRAMRGIADVFADELDAKQLAALHHEIDRALLPLTADPMDVLREAIL